jgi:uroporphyrinogen-III decarboxylase
MVDGFGVRWVEADTAIGGGIPEPGKFLLADVTQWKKKVAIPDVKNYDWKKLAEQEFASSLFGAPIDRDKQAIGFFATCGIWERLAALMGFEEAMIALVEEPEACNELFAAVTDYKIQLAEVAAKYYKADTFTNFDDIATERQMFMSPEIYRKLIKPHHKRLNDAVRNLGMIPIQHTCGHAELCVEDYIETGAEAWNSVQPSNDIAAILDKNGGKFCIEGGYDTTGKPGRTDATVDDVVAEVERCFREYGSKKGFIFAGILVASVGDATAGAKNAAMFETANRLRFAGK